MPLINLLGHLHVDGMSVLLAQRFVLLRVEWLALQVDVAHLSERKRRFNSSASIGLWMSCQGMQYMLTQWNVLCDKVTSWKVVNVIGIHFCLKSNVSIPTLTHQPPVRIPGLFARIPPWNHEFFTSNKHPTICLGIAVAELWSYRANKASVMPGVTKSFDELVPSLHRKITAMALSAKKGDVICKPAQKAKQHSNI